jgi:hypothetical protein
MEEIHLLGQAMLRSVEAGADQLEVRLGKATVVGPEVAELSVQAGKAALGCLGKGVKVAMLLSKAPIEEAGEVAEWVPLGEKA